MGVLFDTCFTLVIGFEGGLTRNEADPGNWTGGRCGVGECRGTNWGISAASYPHLDIANLTLANAKGLYYQDYWCKVAADQFPGQLALLLFDAAVNNGVGQAARWLQQLAEVPQDGVIGPLTINRVQTAIAAHGLGTVCGEYLALRMYDMSRLPTWATFGRGWARRLCRLPYAPVPNGPSLPRQT
jgi:lysozyme family protein